MLCRVCYLIVVFEGCCPSLCLSRRSARVTFLWFVVCVLSDYRDLFALSLVIIGRLCSVIAGFPGQLLNYFRSFLKF